uniref:Uncharacterized protein n=1 Tax=Oryza sativa subsp. japonica TaxID=39947 RepID=Q6Z8Q0_ORYSJ|nr:hypothetical protein [Oryza sativa Japonica Group]BAD10050.1 hypothetical protein [Oryza sativa Japonica Group]
MGAVRGGASIIRGCPGTRSVPGPCQEGSRYYQRQANLRATASSTEAVVVDLSGRHRLVILDV